MVMPSSPRASLVLVQPDIALLYSQVAREPSLPEEVTVTQPEVEHEIKFSTWVSIDRS